MTTSAHAKRLLPVQQALESGDYRLALAKLHPIYRKELHSDRLLMAEIHLRMGSPSKVESVLIDGIRPRSASDSPEAARELELLGWASRQKGDLPKAADILSRAVGVADACKDLEQQCRSNLCLMSVTAQLHGPESVGPLATKSRRLVLRLGQARIIGLFHARFAEVEMRRGALDLAERHLLSALLCARSPSNAFLDGQANVLLSVVSFLRSRFHDAIQHAELALKVSRDVGHRANEVGALSNLGLAQLRVGRFAEAERCFVAARKLSGDRLSDEVPLIDNLAQVQFFKGNDSLCLELIDELRAKTGSQLSREIWARVASNVLLANVLVRQGDLAQAEAVVQESISVAIARQDRLLEAQFQVARAEILARRRSWDAANDALDRASELAGETALHTVALIEWTRAEILAGRGHRAQSEVHQARSLRILETTGDEATRATLTTTRPIAAKERETGQDDEPPAGEGAGIEAVAALLAFSGEPELLGREAVALVARVPAAGGACLAVRRDEDVTTLASTRWSAAETDLERQTVISLGVRPDAEYELSLAPASAPHRGSLTRAVATAVRAAVATASLRRVEAHRTALWPTDDDVESEGRIFVAPKMRELLAATRRIAPTDLPVLITGETGTGKEVFAREVHDASHRSRRPFGVFVCSAVPKETLDSHLFGHRRGAFTGAVDTFDGVIRAHEGGTLLLDEIAEISTDLQTKLLRFLETGEVHPLGEARPVKANVRVIAATNQPIEQMMADGRFREDFYYRLNVMRFHLPPLRERREEILPLIEHFLTRECTQFNKPLPALSDEAVEYLLLHRWPGNIRQLYNEMRRIAAVIEPGLPITPDILAPEIVAERRAAISSATPENQVLVNLDQPLQNAVDELERAMIVRAISDSNGHLETAARRLKITRKGLFLKRQRLEML